MEPEAPLQMPVIGEKAPEFDALTTHGRLKLSDLRGKWVILFSHPADFTPVCTTEFMAFAAIA
ncbi:MAG: redoxin domain-containing protein, partial [Methanoculleus thermophilus]|nr:redoxin domain-containing protein [Methanoculleus thermophilus]